MDTHGNTYSKPPLRILVLIPQAAKREQVVRALKRDLNAEVHVAREGEIPGDEEKFDAAIVGPDIRRRSLSKVAELPTVVVGPGACRLDIPELVRFGVQAELPARCLKCTSERLLAANVLWAVERAQLVKRLRRAERRQQHAALHDALTGLANVRLYRDRFRQLVAQAKRAHKRFALFILDLDHFKEVNDRFGHATGDRLLRAVAGALRECVRETDTLARIGGDEFAILFDDVHGGEDTDRLARRILQRVSEPWVDSGAVIRPALSIGVAVFPDDAASGAALERRADQAMFSAKRRGGNAYVSARTSVRRPRSARGPNGRVADEGRVFVR